MLPKFCEVGGKESFVASFLSFFPKRGSYLLFSVERCYQVETFSKKLETENFQQKPQDYYFSEGWELFPET